MDDGPLFNASYWAVVAQVIPVLALALVLEARSAARRWSKKSTYRLNRQRRSWARIAGVLAIALSFTETTALFELTGPAMSWWRGIIAFATIIFGLGFVAYVPVVEIISVATVDRRLRSERVQRRELRRIRRLELDLLTMLNQLRSAQLDLIEARARAARVVERYEGADAKTRAAIDEATEGTEAGWREALELLAETRALADEKVTQIKRLQKRTQKVRANVTDFDVEKFEARVRKRLRGLA